MYVLVISPGHPDVSLTLGPNPWAATTYNANLPNEVVLTTGMVQARFADLALTITAWSTSGVTYFNLDICSGSITDGAIVYGCNTTCGSNGNVPPNQACAGLPEPFKTHCNYDLNATGQLNFSLSAKNASSSCTMLACGCGDNITCRDCKGIPYGNDSSCLCQPGSYATAAGFASLVGRCYPCPAGAYANVTGATSSNVCLLCSVGTYSASAATKCTQCGAGKYGTAMGSSSMSSGCLQCPNGIYATAPGATSQFSCTQDIVNSTTTLSITYAGSTSITSTLPATTSVAASVTTSNVPTTTSAPPPTTSSVPTCVSSFVSSVPSPAAYSSFTITTGSNQLLSYVYATVTFQGATYYNQKIWCVDYDQLVYIGVDYTASPVYTFEYVLANPTVATGIEQVHRLNQAAFLLNSVVVGTSVASPSSQSWWNQVYAGCSVITSSDLQSALWALLQKPGECDQSTGNGLCEETLGTVNACNVAYLWNLAFAHVPDGTRYYIPSSNCNHAVIYPLILVPEPPSDQSTQVQIVAVDINSWGVSSPVCACSSSTVTSTSSAASTTAATTFSQPITTTSITTCDMSFVQALTTIVGFPPIVPLYEIGPGPQEYSLVPGYIEIGDDGKHFYDNQIVWCIDYFQPVQSGVLYTESPLYPYDYVVENKVLVRHLSQPHRLNQVAFLVNNIQLEVTVATNSPLVFPGQQNQSCSVISSEDFQAAIWALVQNPGDCDGSTGGPLCLGFIGYANVCNAAYLWNFAFANVPDGTSYQIPTNNCSGTVYYPLILIPEPPPDDSTQVQLIAVDINTWGISQPCSCESDSDGSS